VEARVRGLRNAGAGPRRRRDPGRRAERAGRSARPVKQRHGPCAVRDLRTRELRRRAELSAVRTLARRRAAGAHGLGPASDAPAVSGAAPRSASAATAPSETRAGAAPESASLPGHRKGSDLGPARGLRRERQRAFPSSRRSQAPGRRRLPTQFSPVSGTRTSSRRGRSRTRSAAPGMRSWARSSGS
jgi:hypothetical protein